MAHDADTRYFVFASAEGVGSGRFLASTLRDALEGGAELLRVRASLEVPAGAQYAVDFVFASDDRDTDELIRVGTDASDAVACVQLLRCSKVNPGSQNDPASLREALQGGGAVAAIRWTSGNGLVKELELVIDSSDHVRLAVTDI